VVVGSADTGVFGRHGVECPLPQVAGEGEHIGLVDQGDVLAPIALHCQFERVSDGPFGTHARVHRTLCGHLVRCALAQHAAFANVRALGVFTDDHEVVRLAVPRCGADERTLVHVQVEFEPHLQEQAALDHPRRHIGRTHGAEQDGVEGAQVVERRVRQDLTVAQVTRPAQVEVGGVDGHARSADHLHRFGRHLRADSVAADHCNSMCHRPRKIPHTPTEAASHPHRPSRARVAEGVGSVG